MTRLYIAQPFTLTRDDGRQQFFDAGEQEVEDALAAHWYVQAHCAPKPVAAPEPAPLSDTPETLDKAETSESFTPKQGKKVRP